MLKKQMGAMSATGLRSLLILSMVLIVALSSVAFLFFRSYLETFAVQVQSDNAKASISAKDVSRLEELQQKLEDDKIAVTRARSIVADSKYYQYQDQIIADITTYAKNAGVTITSFNFDVTNESNGGRAGAAGGGMMSSPLTSSTQGSAQLPSGLKATTASITIKYPVGYVNVMNFLHLIEVNLTKMQLSGISISRLGNGKVQINPITIEVYTR